MQIFSEESQGFNIKSAAKIILSIIENIPESGRQQCLCYFFLFKNTPPREKKTLFPYFI